MLLVLLVSDSAPHIPGSPHPLEGMPRGGFTGQLFRKQSPLQAVFSMLCSAVPHGPSPVFQSLPGDPIKLPATVIGRFSLSRGLAVANSVV